MDPAPLVPVSWTLVLMALVGDAGDDPAEYLRFYYVDDAALATVYDGQFALLLDKVDGLFYDDETLSMQRRKKQLLRLDTLFETLDEGCEAGWVTRSDGCKTAVPAGGVVSRIVTVTARP